MEFSLEMKKRTQLCEDIIRRQLPAVEGQQERVMEALHYAVEAGGKRLRPLMMLTAYELFKKDSARDGFMRPVLEAAMASMEMIHTFSLCHDDLPCMDNDKYRRGRESVWFKYGVDMGTLCGDALSLYAFEAVSAAVRRQYEAFSQNGGQPWAAFSQKGQPEALSSREGQRQPEAVSSREGQPWAAFSQDGNPGAAGQLLRYMRDAMEAVYYLSHDSGVYGMLGGQVVDVEMTGKALSEDQLHFIYSLKTSRLIAASLSIGAVLAGAPEADIDVLRRVAERVGFAFQIQDDILDVTSTDDTLGKPVHSDEENGKTTYVTLHGIEKAAAEVARLSAEAGELLCSIPSEGLDGEERDFLLSLFEFLVHRDR